MVAQAQDKGLTSEEHFTVDGTLLEAWASLKSFQPRKQKNVPPDDPGNPTVNFHGEKRRTRRMNRRRTLMRACAEGPRQGSEAEL